MWYKIKAWFKNSESIALARLEALSGFIVAVVGCLDWSGLSTLDLGTGLTERQVLLIGGTMLLKGISAEILRRRNSNL